MKRTLKYILGLSWLAVVVYFFYKNHLYYQYDLPGLLGWWPLWVPPLVGYGLFLFINWSAERKKVKLKLTTLRILAGLFLTLFFVGFVTMAVTKPLMYLGQTAVILDDGSAVMNPTQEQIATASYVLDYGSSLKDNFGFYDGVATEIQENLVKASLWDIFIGLTWTYIKIYGTTLLLLLYAYILGTFTYRFLNKKKEPKEDDFEHGALMMVLGLGMVSTLLFLNAAAGQFNLLIIFTTLAVVIAPLYKHALERIKALWNWNKTIEFKTLDPTLPLFLLILLIFGVQMFDNLSPLPRGWDGLNRYVVIAKDLAEGGNLLERGAMYGWELLLGFAYLIDVKLTLAWTSFPGVLAFAFTWLLAKRFSSNTGTALAIATLAIAPMMSFHISDENKIDVAHWLFGTAAIISFLRALSFEKKVKIIDKRYLWLTALLAGFAFTIKLTATILIVTFLSSFALIEGGVIGLIAALLVSIGIMASSGGLGLGQEFLTSAAVNPLITAFGVISGLLVTAFGVFKKKITKKALKTIGIVIILILVPISPWFIKNGIESRSVSPGSLVYGGNEVPQPAFDYDLTLCQSTGFFEEYDRYIGYNDNLFLRIIELPWHLTMNDTGAIGAYVDMGFAFLGFILLFFLFYKPSKSRNFLLTFGAIYFLFWLFKANGVSWYGFPFFSLMVVALAYVFTQMSKDWIGRIALFIVMTLWILTAFDARLNNYAKPGLLLSHTNKITYDDVREGVFPYSNELHDVLEANEGYVYKIGTPLGYFIPGYVGRTYDDQLLDGFECNYRTQNQDFDLVRNKLRDLGFRFLLYDSFTFTVGLDPEGTLKKKIDNFEQFANEQLFVVIFDDKRGHHLFYIPTDEELYQPPAANTEVEITDLDTES